MKTEPLDELETAALPALQHAELVRLARDANLSPKRVQEEAISRRWPTRQAKAARSLAILRRDRGSEALEAFITRTEYARSGQPVTEHTRSRTTMEDKTRIRQSIARLTDNKAKLALMVKHNLVEDAVETIMALAKAGHIYFCEDVDREGDDVFFDTLKKVERPGLIKLDDKEQVGRAVKHRDRICVLLASDPTAERSIPIILDLEGMIAFLKWEREQTVGFVHQAVEKIIAVEPQSMNWRYSRAFTQVIRTYLPEGDEFTKAAEIWILRVQLRRGRTFELRRDALPTPMEPAKDERNELDPIVDRFVELGWTEDQVRAEMLAMIEQVVGSCRPQFMLALAGPKCFKRDDPDRKRLLRTQYLPSMWTNYIVLMDDPPGWVLQAFSRLGGIGLWESNDREWTAERKPIDNDRDFFRSEIIKMIASGKAVKAYQLLLAFGSAWGLFYSERATRYRTEAAQKCMAGLLPAAFSEAFVAGRYGTAAALVQTYGVDACYDEKRIEAEADAFVKADYVAIADQYADVEEKWNEGRVKDSYITRGKGKAWQDALKATSNKRDAKLEELKESRKAAIAEATQLALDLGQRIHLDAFSYIHVSAWEDSAS